MTAELFDGEEPWAEPLAEGVTLLHQRASQCDVALLDAVKQISTDAPFRHMVVPGGHTMSVAMTNCGAQGWVTDRRGYRYQPLDPESARPWPALPELFQRLASEIAAEAGFPHFQPDACLINRYAPGSKMGLHQDKDEQDFSQPIVSISLGLPAVFQLGGIERKDKVRRIALRHGDVLVWGGAARLLHHGILPLKEGDHPAGPYRWNLTLRRAR